MRNYEHGTHRKIGEEGRLTKVSGALLVRRYAVRQPELYRVVEEVSAKRLTTLDKASLCELAQTVTDLEENGVEGVFIEISTTPGAGIVITEAKRRSRPMIQVQPDASRELAVEGAVALAHVCGAGYEATRSILESVTPKIGPGGRMILSDHKKDECRKAVDEYFRGKKGFQLVRKCRLHIIRT